MMAKKCELVMEPPILQQVIHQLVIPEKSDGLIGEKVVYSEKYLKKQKNSDEYILPECGYFTIMKSVLQDDGRVMVALYPKHNHLGRFSDGTNICVGNMVRYKKE